MMEKWRRLALLGPLLLMSCGGGSAPNADNAGAEGAPPDGLKSETHVFEEIGPGIYFATGTGKVNVGSNAMVVVNEDDVVLVDSHITPDAARELIASVAAVTDKPIRYLVNSHFHYDHAHGNQEFPDGVEIIGHEYTRQRLLGDVLNEPTYSVIGSPEYQESVVASLEDKLEGADAETRESLEAQITTLKRHISALGEVEPTPPNTTLVRKMTLHRGAREIEIHHLGRGHTGGDVVVLLPAEKIVFTGDLFYMGAPYLGDGYANEFPQTLEKLKQLDFDIAVPGHGPLIRDRSRIDYNQEYLRKYWSQVKASHDQGLSLEEALAKLDLSGYEQFAAFQFGRPEVRELEVRRMYHLLGGGE